MSTLQVLVRTIDEVRTHPNADALDIAIVGGWQCVIKRGEYVAGDHVVFFEPDTVLPPEWIERFGVEGYTHNGRIRQAKLRGEPSFGLLVRLDNPAWDVGTNVAEYYGATKYLPPTTVTAGDAEEDNPLFVKYTDIENLRTFPDVILPGERVVLTEKLHGTNWRGGIISGQRMAGSKGLRRKDPCRENWNKHTYWYPWSLPEVEGLLDALSRNFPVAILFGEIYGRGIQKMQYDEQGLAFRAFDIYVDGHYMAYDSFRAWCESHGVPTVPEVAVLDYDLAAVRGFAYGQSLIAGHIREGVVVRPLEERHDPRIGRVVLKYMNDGYLLGKFNVDESEP